jgi:hypothetical protein
VNQDDWPPGSVVLGVELDVGAVLAADSDGGHLIVSFREVGGFSRPEGLAGAALVAEAIRVGPGGQSLAPEDVPMLTAIREEMAHPPELCDVGVW